MVVPDAHYCHDDEVFVFGSNLSGKHGKGAARTAKLWYGAHQGKGFGLQGMSFAIPTKDAQIKTLPLYKIKVFVDLFLVEAGNTPQTKYFLTRIGCGLAGYSDKDIAPMFNAAPFNVRKPPGW